MSRKGETYQRVPTLWHIGWGYPCAVMRRRRVRDAATGKRRWRWERYDHAVLTLATARRWQRLEAAGRALIRRDVAEEMFISSGILKAPRRRMWAGPQHAIEEK